jgi:RNA-binding protein Musashi
MGYGGKLFLGGLPQSLTTAAIEDYFSQYGQVVDAIVMPGRGFGFVTFDSGDTAADVQQQRHVLDGRAIDVKLADGKGDGGKGKQPMAPRMHTQAVANSPFVPFHDPGAGSRPTYGSSCSKGGSSGAKGKGAPPGSTDKIFIGGLPLDCTEDKVIAHFEAYGTLVDVVVMKDKVTNKPRGFGFVRFDNTDSADAVMDDYTGHQIDGKWVECKRATPQEQTSSPSPGYKGCGKSFGGCAPAPSSYGGFPTASAYGGGAYAGGYGYAPPVYAYAPPAYGGFYDYGGPPQGCYGPACGMKGKGKGCAPY